MKQTTPRPNGRSARVSEAISPSAAQRLGTGRPSPSKCTGPDEDDTPNAPALMQSATSPAITSISSAVAVRLRASSPITMVECGASDIALTPRPWSSAARYSG
jgi:hypothetical protein